MPQTDILSVPALIVVFLCAAAVITLAGVRLTALADRLADQTRMGEAVFGAVLLGGVTSLPGIVASVTAALEGHAQLAVSNAIGGIAAQTVFLVVADITYREANLEHAAPSVKNLIYGILLCALLALVLTAAHGPDFNVFGVNPMSVVIILAYGFGVRLASRTQDFPGWRPDSTLETHEDKPAPENSGIQHPGRVWLAFTALALTVAAAGFVVAQTGIALVGKTGLSETLVGGFFTAVATSLPELVTSIAAVRQGALTLAVGGIIGGNTFDVLFVAFSDIAYTEGSIYHAVGSEPLFIIALTLLMTAVLLLGLVRREKSGVGNVGFEGGLVLGIYLAGFVVLSLGGR